MNPGQPKRKLSDDATKSPSLRSDAETPSSSALTSNSSSGSTEFTFSLTDGTGQAQGNGGVGTPTSEGSRAFANPNYSETSVRSSPSQNTGPVSGAISRGPNISVITDSSSPGGKDIKGEKPPPLPDRASKSPSQRGDNVPTPSSSGLTSTPSPRSSAFPFSPTYPTSQYQESGAVAESAPSSGSSRAFANPGYSETTVRASPYQNIEPISSAPNISKTDPGRPEKKDIKGGKSPQFLDPTSKSPSQRSDALPTPSSSALNSNPPSRNSAFTFSSNDLSKQSSHFDDSGAVTDTTCPTPSTGNSSTGAIQSFSEIITPTQIKAERDEIFSEVTLPRAVSPLESLPSEEELRKSNIVMAYDMKKFKAGTSSGSDATSCYSSDRQSEPVRAPPRPSRQTGTQATEVSIQLPPSRSSRSQIVNTRRSAQIQPTQETLWSMPTCEMPKDAETQQPLHQERAPRYPFLEGGGRWGTLTDQPRLSQPPEQMEVAQIEEPEAECCSRCCLPRSFCCCWK